jgi:hypothetical protein
MQHLLQMAGYSTYQAQCVAPFLWAVAASGILYMVFPFIAESTNKRKKSPVQHSPTKVDAAQSHT